MSYYQGPSPEYQTAQQYMAAAKQARLDLAEAKIGTVVFEGAIEVTAALDKKKVCLVTQPKGNDPDKFLGPQISDQLIRAHGFNSVDTIRTVGFYSGTHKLFVSPILPFFLERGEKKALIVTAAECIMENPAIDVIEEVLRFAHKADHSVVIPIINYPLNDEDRVNSVMKQWQQEAEKVYRSKPAVVNLPKAPLSPTLARSYLTALCQVKQREADPAAIDYVLETVPLRIGVLENLTAKFHVNPYGFSNTLTAWHTITSELRTWQDCGYITDDEYRAVQQKCIADKQTL